jgi:hypothetical protein
LHEELEDNDEDDCKYRDDLVDDDDSFPAYFFWVEFLDFFSERVIHFAFEHELSGENGDALLSWCRGMGYRGWL